MPEPAYATIAGIYAQRIRSGELAPGARLPSLSEIVRKHGVSDIVARKALEVLQSQGLVESVRRRGTFVSELPRPESTPQHTVGLAAAVIDAEHRALAVRQRDNGIWQPPGGVLQLGESLREGLTRAVLTTTGLTVEPQFISGAYKAMTSGLVTIAFRCRVTGGELQPSGETAELRWLTPEQVPAYMDERFSARIRDAYEPDRTQARGHSAMNLL